MKQRNDLYLYTLLVLAFGMTLVEIVVNLAGEVVSVYTQSLYGGVSLLLSILWAYNDAKRAGIHRPIDFGFFIYFFWPIALPWYLIRTRGLEGALVFSGFILLFFGPWLAGLVAYEYYS